jgi:hypothetical protein
MPDVIRCLRCEYSCAYLTTQRARGCGCIGHPAFPAPSIFKGETFWHSSSAARGENVDVCRRHSGARVQRAKSRDAAHRLGMTASKGLRARNDALMNGLGCLTIAIGNLQAPPGFAKASRGNLRRFATIIRGWPRQPKLRSSVGWCPWPESNQHSLRNSILSRARLPVPPQGHFTTPAKRAGAAKPAEYSGRRCPVNPRRCDCRSPRQHSLRGIGRCLARSIS